MNYKRVVVAAILSAAVGGLGTACHVAAPSAAPKTGTIPATTTPAPASTTQAAAPGDTGTGATPSQSSPHSPAAPTPTPTQAVPTPAASSPVLGAAWAPGVQGYGKARPAGLSSNGDPTGIVYHLTWSSWGGATATGTGIAEYLAPGQSVAQGSPEHATVVAFDLGTCNGTAAYRAIEWYFPGHGQHFDPTRYFDACTGQDHGM